MTAKHGVKINPLFLVGVLLAVTGVALTTGCGSQVDDISTDLGQPVELRPGQTVSLEAEELQVKFVEVVSDSRCPTGVECFWAGEVAATLQITYQGESYIKTIIQPGLTSSMSTVSFLEYEIRFNVLPYPEEGKEIKPDEYRLQLVINKTP